jgi:hypothetical protein
MIPSIASVTSIENPILDSDISSFGFFAAPYASTCIPIVNQPFEETRRFKWNVENFIHKKMEFSYYVGEGPLYWYRIDWYPSPCPPNPCIEIGPTIEYIAPNCPYEIIENCLILPPCPCDISCVPGTCISQTVEVWHMLATSVIHLCERINQECCHRKPPGYMRRVRQYMRPALCCDVEKRGPGTDEYVDVNFLKCECGNLVDPCIAVIVYPCHVNRCGIHGPAFAGGPVPPISVIKMAPDILGHAPMAIMQDEVSAVPMPVQMVPPKEAQPVNRVVNKFGPSIPELIHCKHNLYEIDIFKDFLRMNKIKFDSMDLFYNKNYNSWQGSNTFKDWKASIEWTPSENSGYKLNIMLDKKSAKTKLSLFVKTDGFINDKNIFDVMCDYDTKTGTLSSRKSILQSKVIKDDIGLFKSGWKSKLILKG